jgi:hypothetical protein
MRKTADRAKSWNFGMASFSLIWIDYGAAYARGVDAAGTPLLDADACAPAPVRLHRH